MSGGKPNVIEGWRARQVEGGETVEAKTIFGAGDFSVELGEARLRIRELEEKLAKVRRLCHRESGLLLDGTSPSTEERPQMPNVTYFSDFLLEVIGGREPRLVDVPKSDREIIRELSSERHNALARVKQLEAQLSKMFDDIQEDTASLLKLRECIDDHGVWPDEQTNDDGDYEACVKFMAARLRELEEKLGESVVQDFGAFRFMGDEFTFQGTTYYRADHPRVLRGDEFRVHGHIEKITGCTTEQIGVNPDFVPVVIDSRGRKWGPWLSPLSGDPDQQPLRAFWLANYQLAPGEYLDEEAGVVRRREPEPEAKNPEPFFTDDHGDVWEFIKFRQGWCAILDTRPKRFLVYSANEEGPVADALRAYVASVGKEGE